MVEAIVALHFALNTPEDKIVFDVSHQAYPHKVRVTAQRLGVSVWGLGQQRAHRSKNLISAAPSFSCSPVCIPVYMCCVSFCLFPFHWHRAASFGLISAHLVSFAKLPVPPVLYPFLVLFSTLFLNLLLSRPLSLSVLLQFPLSLYLRVFVRFSFFCTACPHTRT